MKSEIKTESLLLVSFTFSRKEARQEEKIGHETSRKEWGQVVNEWNRQKAAQTTQM